MREAVYISNVSRMRAGSLGPLNALKTKNYFGAFSPQTFFILLGSPWGCCYLVPQWGHLIHTPGAGSLRALRHRTNVGRVADLVPITTTLVTVRFVSLRGSASNLCAVR